MAQAVARGGMGLVEITWNSQNPEALIRQLRQDLPDRLVGAGTILTEQQLQAAIAAGAQFLFCPHVERELIAAAAAASIPIVPGAMSPTEIIAAWHSGASCVKVFPAGTLGGASYIRSLLAPLGEIPLIPTGGVTLDNAPDFLAAGAIAVGLSSQLFPPALLETEDWPAIAQLARTLQSALAPFI